MLLKSFNLEHNFTKRACCEILLHKMAIEEYRFQEKKKLKFEILIILHEKVQIQYVDQISKGLI